MGLLNGKESDTKSGRERGRGGEREGGERVGERERDGRRRGVISLFVFRVLRIVLF